MASLGDEAGRQARLRASAADREQAIEVLKVAYVQDRITKDELDHRIGQALAARTYADLGVLTSDIPGGVIRARPAEPASRSDASKRQVIWRASTAIASTGFVVFEAAAVAHHLNPVVGVIAGLVAGGFAAGLLAVLLALVAWVIDRPPHTVIRSTGVG
jgi:hypothetical protein